MSARLDPEVVESFHDLWADIVCPGGEWDHDQVMRELHDYKMLLDNVPKVYDSVTGGRVSKPNTLAEAVIGEADEYLERCVAERLQEELEELASEFIEPAVSRSIELQPGTRLLHIRGVAVTLDRRKSPDDNHHGLPYHPGWWLRGEAGGLSDSVIDDPDGEWSLLDPFWEP